SSLQRMSPMRGLFLLLLAFGCGATPAIEGPGSVAQLHHTAWYAKDGAPTDAWAIAQTRDGWLWFGSPSGLHRFDGVAFERIATDARDPDRSRAVSTFLALDSGGLLIGYVHGGASHWQNGGFPHYPMEGG